jgi:hypothetical protein
MNFKYPNKVEPRLKRYLKVVSLFLDVEPIILSDYREGDPRTHGKGMAVDTYWPNIDPLIVLEKVKELDLFGGVGIYLNEKDVVSFHFDIREHKEDGDIYSWGCFITSQNGNREYNYVAMNLVVDKIKQKGL